MFLIFNEHIECLLKIARNKALHLVAVKPDQGAQKIRRQKGLAAGLLVDNNLRQNATGQILAAFSVKNHKIMTLLDHLAQIIERHITAAPCVIKTTVRIFLDYGWTVIFSLGHEFTFHALAIFKNVVTREVDLYFFVYCYYAQNYLKKKYMIAKLQNFFYAAL